MAIVDNRCRLILVAPELESTPAVEEALAGALRGGDVSSVILPQYGIGDSDFQKRAEKIVPLVQKAGAAALIAGEPRVASRCKADGLHISGGIEDMEDAMDRFSPDLIVGGGRAKDRHSALEIGELRPDYIFFGKIDGDIKDVAHPKNIALGDWWASMIEIPCVVMGGRVPESAIEVAESGAEFVALRQAVFDDPEQAAIRVAHVNALLDEKAPRFED